MRFGFLAASLAMLALTACGVREPPIRAPAPAACDPPALPIAIGGAAVEGDIPAGEAYPATADYFCFAVPDGLDRVTLSLGGFTADLDLYVGSATIQSVQGIDISAGQNYEWSSNVYGHGDEAIVIEAPAAGMYYAEIVSYESDASHYTFAVR